MGSAKDFLNEISQSHLREAKMILEAHNVNPIIMGSGNFEYWTVLWHGEEAWILTIRLKHGCEGEGWILRHKKPGS